MKKLTTKNAGKLSLAKESVKSLTVQTAVRTGIEIIVSQYNYLCQTRTPGCKFATTGCPM